MGRKKLNKPKLPWKMQQFIKAPWASTLRAERICKDFELSEEFMDKYDRYLNWNKICFYQKMSEEFIEKHLHRLNSLNIKTLIDRELVNEGFIRKHIDIIGWRNLSSSRAPFSLNFLREFKDMIDWDYYFYSHTVDQNFVEEFKDVTDWSSIVGKTKMSEEFIEKYRVEMGNSHYSFWDGICQYQKLSEAFMDKWDRYIDWQIVSYSQQLSEPFIEKHADKLNWKYIVVKQKMSEDFIINHTKYFTKFNSYDWAKVIKYNKVSRKFLRRYKKQFDWINLKWTLDRIENLKKANKDYKNEEFLTKLDYNFVLKMMEEMKEKN